MFFFCFVAFIIKIINAASFIEGLRAYVET